MLIGDCVFDAGTFPLNSSSRASSFPSPISIFLLLPPFFLRVSYIDRKGPRIDQLAHWCIVVPCSAAV
jgi:hypothetical protein